MTLESISNNLAWHVAVVESVSTSKPSLMTCCHYLSSNCQGIFKGRALLPRVLVIIGEEE